jgi:four helix bundle protein
MRDHTKLRAFELADGLALAVYSATRAFPKEEMFGLTSQMRRAAVSVASNIVEGCARPSQADYVHFLCTAFASTRELEYQVSLAYRIGYLDEAAYQPLRSQCAETAKVLNGLICALRISKDQTTQKDTG